jgi:hypothetical protein
MIADNAIQAKYKCMDIACDFFTSNRERFYTHLLSHFEKNKLNRFYLRCSYCFMKSEAPQELLDHHDTFHKYCRFQCNKCFYRSAVPMSVYDHQSQYHDSKFRILECMDIPLLRENDIDQEKMELKCRNKKEFFDCIGNY